MSVILFTKDDLYQNLANMYEGLKRLIQAGEEDDYKFYKSLRRLHFANVATFLCQYHDDTKLSDAELASIDPFIELQGKAIPGMSNLEKLNLFLGEWGSLQYNLVTNDGELYKATEAYEYINGLALRLSRAVVEQAVHTEQSR
jgi:hypothetical protein